MIRPILTYTAETLCCTETEHERLRIFERYVIRKIVGPVKINTDGLRMKTKTNAEIMQIMKNENIVKCIKVQRIRWMNKEKK